MTYKIEVDFDVYRELMIRRTRESMTFNNVIAELLGLAHQEVPPVESVGYRLRGTWTPTASANDLLIGVLQTLAMENPDFLPQLAAHANARARTRVYLSQNRNDLYPGRPDLTHFSSEITPGWYVGTNISNQQKIQLLRNACEVAGITYGVDLVITIDPSTPSANAACATD